MTELISHTILLSFVCVSAQDFIVFDIKLTNKIFESLYFFVHYLQQNVSNLTSKCQLLHHRLPLRHFASRRHLQDRCYCCFLHLMSSEMDSNRWKSLPKTLTAGGENQQVRNVSTECDVPGHGGVPILYHKFRIYYKNK